MISNFKVDKDNSILTLFVQRLRLDFKIKNNGFLLEYLGLRDISVGSGFDGAIVVDFLNSSKGLKFKGEEE